MVPFPLLDRAAPVCAELLPPKGHQLHQQPGPCEDSWAAQTTKTKPRGTRQLKTLSGVPRARSSWSGSGTTVPLGTVATQGAPEHQPTTNTHAQHQLSNGHFTASAPLRLHIELLAPDHLRRYVVIVPRKASPREAPYSRYDARNPRLHPGTPLSLAPVPCTLPVHAAAHTKHYHKECTACRLDCHLSINPTTHTADDQTFLHHEGGPTDRAPATLYPH